MARRQPDFNKCAVCKIREMNVREDDDLQLCFEKLGKT